MAAIEQEGWGDVDPSGTPRPPYVATDEERRRWDLCVRLTEATWRRFEPSSPVDGTFLIRTVRALYRSDVPTGPDEETVEEAAFAVAENAGNDSLLGAADEAATRFRF